MSKHELDLSEQDEPTNPVPSLIVGAETQRALVQLFPESDSSDIIANRRDDLSIFSVKEAVSAPTNPYVSTLALPGLAFGRDSFMLQEEPLSALGAFVSCEYPDRNLYPNLYLAQISDAASQQKERGRKVVLIGNSLGGTFFPTPGVGA